MTQKDKIIEYMRDRGSITTLEALRHCGCMRLGARVFELKRLGYNIVTHKIAALKADGTTAYVAEYRLEET